MKVVLIFQCHLLSGLFFLTEVQKSQYVKESVSFYLSIKEHTKLSCCAPIGFQHALLVMFHLHF